MNPESDDKLNYLPRVEAVRGIAALMVAVSHGMQVLQIHSAMGGAITFVMIHIFNGGAAVLMFFVISGFVLGLSLDKTTGQHFVKKTALFYLRRILRLYPAYLACLAVVLCYLFYLHTPRNFTLETWWFNSFYQSLPQWGDAWDIFFFKNITVIPISWTLRSELICSMLLPFLHWISRRMGHLGNLCVAVFFIILPHCFDNQFIKNLPFFYLGLIVPTVGLHYFNIIKGRPALCRVLLLASIPLWVLNFPDSAGNFWIIIESVSCFFIVTSLAAHSNNYAFRLLDLHIVRFYGKISYSFYLFHFICLYWLARVCLWTNPWGIETYPLVYNFLLIISSCALASVIAYYSWRHVELPFIAFSRSITNIWRIDTQRKKPAGR